MCFTDMHTALLFVLLSFVCLHEVFWRTLTVIIIFLQHFLQETSQILLVSRGLCLTIICFNLWKPKKIHKFSYQLIILVRTNDIKIKGLKMSVESCL